MPRKLKQAATLVIIFFAVGVLFCSPLLADDGIGSEVSASFPTRASRDIDWSDGATNAPATGSSACASTASSQGSVQHSWQRGAAGASSNSTAGGFQHGAANLPGSTTGNAAPSQLNASESSTDTQGMFTRFKNRVVSVWNSPTWDLYITAYTWHNRLFYDQSHIKRYNEHPWGGGIGKSMYDEDGDWHALYAMGFMDSNYHFEPFAGYGFLKNWRLDKAGDWRVGVGFTAAVTARENYNYIPLPIVLPLVGIGYKRLSVQATYIPGVKNNGNVLFTWLHWQLTD